MLLWVMIAFGIIGILSIILSIKVLDGQQVLLFIGIGCLVACGIMGLFGGIF